MKRYRFLCFVAVVCALISWSSDARAMPIRDLADLQSVIVYERSSASGPDAYIYSPAAPAVLQRIADLGASTNDFATVASEYYDVYFSGPDGAPDPDGAFLTVDAIYTSSNDSGFNVSEVSLVFAGSVEEFADRYTRVNAVDPRAFPATAPNAIDGDLDTHTSLGNSTDQQNRLSMTFGFASSVPEPSGMIALLLFVFTIAPAVTRRTLGLRS